MSSPLQQALVTLLRERLSLACFLVERCIRSRFDPQLIPRLLPDVSAASPDDDRPDLAIELWHPARQVAVHAIILEVLVDPDADKRYAWPVYQSLTRLQLECPTLLAVLTPTTPVERWSSAPIDLDGVGGSMIRPFAIGPQIIPQLTSPTHALRNPELAVLSAIAHGHTARGAAIGNAAIAACRGLDEERAKLYVDLIFVHLSDDAREALESALGLESYEPQTPLGRALESERRK